MKQAARPDTRPPGIVENYKGFSMDTTPGHLPSDQPLDLVRRPAGQLHDFPVEVRWEVTRRHPYYLSLWEEVKRYRRGWPDDPPERKVFGYAATLVLGAIGVTGVPVSPVTPFSELIGAGGDPDFLGGSVLLMSLRSVVAMMLTALPPAERAFVGLARSVLHLTADENDRNRKLLLPGKCNLSAPPPGLAFRIVGDPGRLEWEPDPLDGIRADDAMTPGEKEHTRGPAPTTRDAATDWLADLLQNGPVAVEEIKKQAKNAGLAWRTIRRANEVLGIVPRKRTFAGGWVWALPEHGQPDAQGGQVPRRCPSSGIPGHLRRRDGLPVRVQQPRRPGRRATTGLTQEHRGGYP